MCEVENSNIVPLGIDLSEFYMSVEWDILEVPAVRYVNHIIFMILFQLSAIKDTFNILSPSMHCQSYQYHESISS